MAAMQESYGIPYAMAVHDIERIEEVRIGEVNDKLELGWKALHFGTIHTSGFPFDGDQNSEFYAVMGVPRPKYCTGAINNSHRILQVWDNANAIWTCPECGA